MYVNPLGEPHISVSYTHLDVYKRQLENPEVILQVRDLVKYFPVRMGFWQSMRTKEQPVLRAVDGVSLDVYKGEILGLVGESGCGKTTLARTILRLTDATGGEAVLELSLIHIYPKANSSLVTARSTTTCLPRRSLLGSTIRLMRQAVQRPQ